MEVLSLNFIIISHFRVERCHFCILMNSSDTNLKFHYNSNGGKSIYLLDGTAIFVVPLTVLSVVYCVVRRIYKKWKASTLPRSNDSTQIPTFLVSYFLVVSSNVENINKPLTWFIRCIRFF